jgi:hypothetical protein
LRNHDARSHCAPNRRAELWQALGLLRQNPPAKLKLESVSTVLYWGEKHWQPARLRLIKEVPASR